MIRIRVFPIIKKKIRVFLKNQLNVKERRKKKGDLTKQILFFREEKKEEEEDSWLPYFNRSKCSKFEFQQWFSGCEVILQWVIVANLNFSSSLVDVKLFRSGFWLLEVSIAANYVLYAESKMSQLIICLESVFSRDNYGPKFMLLGFPLCLYIM